MAGSKGVSIKGDRGKKEREHIFIGLCISNTVPCLLLFHARSAYYVHETEEIYTATQLNLAKLTKEPSACGHKEAQRSTSHIMVTSCCVHHQETDII